MPNHPLHPARGFTLVELLVVVALTAILASAAAPSFRGLLANRRVAAAASDMQALLLYARAEAVYRRTPVRVQATADGTRWEARSAAGLLRASQVSEAVTATGGGALDFAAGGHAAPAPFAVAFHAAAARQQECVRVTRAGLVRRESQMPGAVC